MIWSGSEKRARGLKRVLAALIVLAALGVSGALFGALLSDAPVLAQSSVPVASPAADGIPEPPRGWSATPEAGASSAGIASMGWSKVPTSLGEVRWIFVIQTSPNVVFASIDGIGLFLSQDAGETWTPMSTVGLTNKSVQSFAVCPSGKIYAGTWGGGVFRHDPQVSRWTQVNNGLPQLYISAVSCDAQNVALVGTYDQGVFRTTDEGANWTPANTGLRAGISDHQIMTLFSVPGIIGLGTANGAYVSYNGGVTWNAAGLIGFAVYDFAVDRTGSNEIWAATDTGGVFSSKDMGGTWMSIGGPSTIYTVSQGWDLALYAGTPDSGIYRYEEGQWVLDGLTNPVRKIYLIRRVAYERMLAGTNDGLWAAITILRTPTPSPTSTRTPTKTSTPTSTPTATNTPVVPRVALSMRSAPEGSIEAGGQIDYTIDYQVVGVDVASSVVITNAVPANVQLVSGSIVPTDNAAVNGNIISWSLGDLAVGAAGELSYRIEAPTPSATATATPSPEAIEAAGGAVASALYLPLPVRQGQPASATAGPVTVVNRGAFAYWSYGGADYQARSNSVINSDVPPVYLPLIQR